MTPWVTWKEEGRRAVPLLGREPIQDQLLAVVAEFIGTGLFTFITCLAAVSSSQFNPGGLNLPQIILLALNAGFTICAIVYSTAKVSGGHVNPAVSISLALVGKEPILKTLFYLIAQFSGALVGAAFVKAATPSNIQGNLGSHALGDGISIGQGVLLESIFTFLLLFVVFSTAVSDFRHGMGKFAPIPIGLCVTFNALAGIPLTGSSMNPARSFGPAIVSGTTKNLWIYFVGPLTGACLCALFYQFVYIRRFSEIEEKRQLTIN